jgi:hypothetical protein
MVLVIRGEQAPVLDFGGSVGGGLARERCAIAVANLQCSSNRRCHANSCWTQQRRRGQASGRASDGFPLRLALWVESSER